MTSTNRNTRDPVINQDSKTHQFKVNHNSDKPDRQYNQKVQQNVRYNQQTDRYTR